ncbi:MAG: hypothetical protein KF802_01215 [Bdellovibrionaceae bacterium]|nr:hypothetical protein [Pseudobdellovibrionaceae bacterium]
MGGIKLPDPIKAINDVVKGVDNAVKQVNKDVTESIARSDLGRVAGAALQPVAAAKDASIDVIKGDFGRAANRLTGAAVNVLNPTSQIIGSSTSIQKALSSDFGNAVTLGWGRDAVEVNRRATDLAQTGRNLEQSDFSSYARYGIRSATLAAGGAYAAGVMGGAGAPAAVAGGTSGGGALTGIGATLLPEIGNIARDGIKNMINPKTPAGGTSLPEVSGSSNLMLPVAIGGFVLLLVALVARRK